MHYHVWIRATADSRAFVMRPRRYDVRISAASAAARLVSDPACRMVRQCDACPRGQRSKRRRRPGPYLLAWRLAARLGVTFAEAQTVVSDVWR